MTKRKLPPAPQSEDEAVQELRKSPLFPPEPPGTCYAVLEFPCVVENVADWDAAYKNAIVQLRERLEKDPDSLGMSLVSEDRYYEILSGSDDDSDKHPLFGRAFSWVMRPTNLPDSPAALMAAVDAENQTMLEDDPAGSPYEVTRLAALSGMTALDVRFTHWFHGKENVKRIGDGSHDLSYAEIIWLLHQSVIKDQLGDHVFFEGLIPVASDGSVPLFDVFMGS